MHSFERHIQETIDRLGLLRRSSPVLVALSGGADSVALLSALVSLGYNCIAAHCNFHLRGAESVRDMRHAEAIARVLGVDIYIREFNVAERMKTTGESVEMACRELRYDWFHQLLDRDYSQAIAVAHHREDNIETFFLNLLRSSGLAGLTGMDYRRGFIVRPMLDVGRQEIEKYLADKGLDFVTDSSNASNDFKRNRLRNVVLPALESNFPGATDAILAAMSHLADSQRLVNHAVSTAMAQIGAKDDYIDVPTLISVHGLETARLLLFEWLKPKGLNVTQIDNIVRACVNGSSGLTFKIDAERFAELDRGILSLHRFAENPNRDDSHVIMLGHDVLTPIHIQVTPHHVTEFKPERDPDIMYLDMRALEGIAEFRLRNPRLGDRMLPYGMEHDKPVSEILKDAKFSASQKRSVWLLTRNDVILWVVGVRASAHFAVSPATRRYLRLKLTNR